MTRVNTEQLKHTPWFAKAGAACSIVPIARFVGPDIFALKGGGYGCLFALTGIDEEGLTDQELESRMRSIEGSLRGLPEGSCLYQYTRVMSGFNLPRQAKYANPATEVFASDRLTFLEKTAGFRRIDLHWCLTLEPSKVKAFERKPDENAADTSRMLADLEKTATILQSHLGNAIGLRLLGKNETFQFFSYLFNLEEWAERYQLRSDTGVDRQIVKTPIAWHSDYLQVGKRHVQMFSLKTTPEASRPCLFSGLLTLDCDSVLCSTWRVKSTSSARSEIDAQEKFISFFKVGVLTRVMSGRDTASLETGAGAKAANNSVDDLSDVIRSLDKKAQGEYSLRLLLAARSQEQLRNTVPAVHRIFVDARAQVMEETLGNLSAFYAMFPGNHKFNVFPLWLAEDHHARLSSVFAPHIGHPHSEDLDNEYLNIFETRTRTPFFQDVYVDGVRVMLIIGPTGSGKTTVLASIREGAEKSGYTIEGFAPTSRASAQLREVGIDATTLQSFLARGDNHPSASPESRHLYMLDESSLASTRQMRAFLDKLNPNDRVLVIGDTSQHQGVDAGKPFEQMQDAGMRTSQLDHIMRQKDTELLKAVEELAKNNTQQGIDMLASQGRITEITDRQERIAAIARDYAAQPENTIVVSPDNRSRQQINEAVRAELLDKGALASDGQPFRTLTHRSDMTGADRTWAARYNAGDVLQYTTGSKAEGIERDSFATVRTVDARANTLTVELENGTSVTYDPRRLRGVQVFRETERDFATGDRIQMTSTNRELGVANRDLGTITGIENGQMSVRMDGKAERTISFGTAEFRQFDHGYAVTSHSSQGLTAGRVLAHFDTGGAHSLINTRLAYVAISRASDDARVYTNNAETLGQRLATDISKTAAVDFRPSSSATEVQQAVAAFRANDPATGTAKLQELGRIHEYANPEHRMAAVALSYTAQEDRAVVVAPDAGERRELTQLIRDELRHQGRLAPESRSVPILVEQHFGNPRLAANYTPGDEIHYKAGSLVEHGIADNSTARVLSVDARANTLTIATRDGNETSYNPALLKKQTAQSTVYREEQRDLAVGERIALTASDRDAHIRSGDFATVERIGEDGTPSVRLDNGKSPELEPQMARHIEYGYVVETAQRAPVDRVLVTGEASQLAQQREALTRLSPHIRDFSLYTSDSREMSVGKALPGAEIASSVTELSLPLGTPSSVSTPEAELPGFGIGL